MERGREKESERKRNKLTERERKKEIHKQENGARKEYSKVQHALLSLSVFVGLRTLSLFFFAFFRGFFKIIFFFFLNTLSFCCS